MRRRALVWAHTNERTDLRKAALPFPEFSVSYFVRRGQMEEESCRELSSVLILKRKMWLRSSSLGVSVVQKAATWTTVTRLGALSRLLGVSGNLRRNILDHSEKHQAGYNSSGNLGARDWVQRSCLGSRVEASVPVKDAFELHLYQKLVQSIPKVGLSVCSLNFSWEPLMGNIFNLIFP